MSINLFFLHFAAAPKQKVKVVSVAKLIATAIQFMTSGKVREHTGNTNSWPPDAKSCPLNCAFAALPYRHFVHGDHAPRIISTVIDHAWMRSARLKTALFLPCVL